MEYFAGDYADISPADNANFSNNNAAHFTVDDLLDFSKEDETLPDAFLDSSAGNSGDSSTVTAVGSCNSTVSGGGDRQFHGCRSFIESHFSGDEFCVMYDDLAELEWLSNFVEESFSTDDTAYVAAAAVKTVSSSAHKPPPIFPTEVAVPGKARSKRPRAAPCDWSSRLPVLSPETAPSRETPARRCLHCASDRTPQWRTGPMGPKTLCNACGVRYKSGRLVPEYRPASSPSFVSTRHSNSHRKVLELRRQKEVRVGRPMIGGHQVFNGCDEFLVRHHGGINSPDLRHVI